MAFLGSGQVFHRRLVPGPLLGQTPRPPPLLPWVTHMKAAMDGVGLGCSPRQEGEGRKQNSAHCKPQPAHKTHPNTRARDKDAQGRTSVSGWTKVTGPILASGE